MTPEQINLVQTSFKSVAPIASKAADLFYDRLFEIAPDVRPMFPADLSGQKVKLIAMLATAVNNCTNLMSYCLRFAISAPGIAATVSLTRTMRPLARLCCGRWSEGSDRPSQPTSRSLGVRHTRPWLALCAVPDRSAFRHIPGYRRVERQQSL